jgi:prepilin-type N-terminal cleavage/methylation domain-containing protein
LDKRNKKGFTLPEILLVFALIGIIVSIVIPSISRNIEDNRNKMLWRKAYASLDQATLQLLANNGVDFTGYFQWDNDTTNKYAGQLNYVKKCNNDPGCWHAANAWKLMSGTPCSWNYDDGFILGNGMLVGIFAYDPNCMNTTYTPQGPSCAELIVDTNGWAGPNTVGKDIFMAYIKKGGLFPYGDNEPLYYNDCKATDGGWDCSAMYLYQ